MKDWSNVGLIVGRGDDHDIVYQGLHDYIGNRSKDLIVYDNDFKPDTPGQTLASKVEGSCQEADEQLRQYVEILKSLLSEGDIEGDSESIINSLIALVSPMIDVFSNTCQENATNLAAYQEAIDDADKDLYND